MIDKEVLYDSIANAINISENMFDYAETEYKKISKWIEENSKEYEINIYPQGSFALGTAVKPYDREDEYDVDLVCEYQKDYGFTAKKLKKTEVYSILTQYDRAFRIKENRRCWQVTYAHNQKFHLDVVPAVLRNGYIDITEQLSNDNYEYIGSNPKGYIAWFQSKQRIRYDAIKTGIISNQRNLYEYGDIKPIKEYKIRTPLQKAIQILKRHRDILFKDDTNNLAPVSILITTISANLYKNENTITATLYSILRGAKDYVEQCKENGKYCIYNPSFPNENFADKWVEHPERAVAFLNWLDDAKRDLIDNFDSTQNDVDLATLIECALGRSVSEHVFGNQKSVLLESNKNCEGNTTAVIPYKVQAILGAPQRQKLDRYPKGYRVIISAEVTTENGLKYQYSNDGRPIEKESTIVFKAGVSGIRKPFVIKWQVVNIGTEAAIHNDLRGEFITEEVNTFKHTEHTAYNGSHSIQCFVFKHGVCIAQSKIFIVNIR